MYVYLFESTLKAEKHARNSYSGNTASFVFSQCSGPNSHATCLFMLHFCKRFIRVCMQSRDLIQPRRDSFGPPADILGLSTYPTVPNPREAFRSFSVISMSWTAIELGAPVLFISCRDFQHFFEGDEYGRNASHFRR